MKYSRNKIDYAEEKKNVTIIYILKNNRRSPTAKKK